MKWTSTSLLFGLLTVATTMAAPSRYQGIMDEMQTLHNQYPQYTVIYSLGKNDDGDDIYAMRVSTTPSQIDPKKVGNLFVATHHGNEGGAATFAVEFTKKLLSRYQSTELFRGDLAQTEWTIVPVLNIQGYNANSRYEHGQDPNRDYPGPCISAAGGRLKSIQIAMNVMKSRIYSGSLTVHGYVGAMTYPWGIDVTNLHTNDHNLFDQMAAKAAAVNGYRFGTSTDVVYPCDGTFEDYVYWKHGMWSLLLELRDGTPGDIASSVDAITVYFNEIESSPSARNQLTGQCRNSGRMDLANE